MPSILDTAPFPFHNRAAQQLRNNLAAQYASPAVARRIVEESGMDTSVIFFEQAAIDLWHEILTAAAHRGMVRDLVTCVHAKLGANSPYRAFYTALLADKPPVLSSERRAPDGTPQFIAGGDDILDPEALLYRDDLTFSLGRIPALIATLQRLIQLAPAVCRFDVRLASGSQRGTGFRIAPDLLLTNWHVLHDFDKQRAHAVTAEFGYESDASDNALQATPINCDVASIVADEADDWGVIRVATPLNAAWPIISLSGAVVPTLQDSAFIIQHPQGDRKRIGFVRNQVTNFNDRVVHYLTDTQEGASGAPVFDAAGRLIALHHAGGRPQDVIGKPPSKKNEGIRIERIRAGLAAAGVAIP